MNKIRTWILYVCLIFLFSACGTDEANEDNQTTDIKEDVLHSSMQIFEMQLLDDYGNEISDDGGGWYILAEQFQIQLDFQGEVDAITVFFIPTGSSTLSHRQQLVVHPLYDTEDQGIEIFSSEYGEKAKRAIFDVVMEMGWSGQLYVMIENMENAAFSEQINVSME